MDKTHCMGPLLSSSGCTELKTVGTDSHAVPLSIVFLWNKTETCWGRECQQCMSPQKNGSMAWMSSESHISGGEHCWTQKQIQSFDDQQWCQQRSRGGAGSGQEEVSERLMLALSVVQQQRASLDQSKHREIYFSGTSARCMQSSGLKSA